MSKEYDEYLEEHRKAVRDAADWMMNNIDKDTHGVVDNYEHFIGILSHDKSKYDPEEYDAYDAYFYGKPDKDAFNRAWLHHIHNNPHHWQHWVLVNDDDGTIALKMPTNAAFEMICDWWSFSWRTGNLYEVFDWYAAHRDRIVMHRETREYVESMLDAIKEVLDSEKEQ